MNVKITFTDGVSVTLLDSDLTAERLVTALNNDFEFLSVTVAGDKNLVVHKAHIARVVFGED